MIKDEDEREKTRALLKESYKYIRDAYKITAGRDAVGNFVSVAASGFTTLCQNAGNFIDNVSMKLPDLDIERVAVKSGDKKIKNPNIPPDKLIRYNFLEVWIRLAS